MSDLQDRGDCPGPYKSLKVTEEVACCGLICSWKSSRGRHHAQADPRNSPQRKADVGWQMDELQAGNYSI